jgi:peptidoglycan hydrolase-like protein with peptidoglycan-binding domain
MTDRTSRWLLYGSLGLIGIGGTILVVRLIHPATPKTSISLASCGALGYRYSTKDSGKSLPCVMVIQERLNTLIGARLPVTGHYDSATAQAVRTFQQHFGLQNAPGEQLGVFGSPSDWATLEEGKTMIIK